MREFPGFETIELDQEVAIPALERPRAVEFQEGFLVLELSEGALLQALGI